MDHHQTKANVHSGTPRDVDTRTPEPLTLLPQPVETEVAVLSRPGRRFISQRISRQLAVLALLASWSWFGVHFICTAVYLLPVSTLTARLYPLASTYLLPYFRQRWSLFAPDPDGKTKHFQFRCRIQLEDGALSDSPLYDFSAGFYAHTWKTRLGPGHRVHRAYTSPLNALSSERSKDTEVMAYLAEGLPNELEALKQQEIRIRNAKIAYANELAGRLSAFACRQQFPTATIVQSNAVMDIVTPPSFRERLALDATGSSVRVDFGWRELDAAPDSAATNTFLAERK